MSGCFQQFGGHRRVLWKVVPGRIADEYHHIPQCGVTLMVVMLSLWQLWEQRMGVCAPFLL